MAEAQLASGEEAERDYIGEVSRQLGIRADCPPRAAGEEEAIVVCGRRSQSERYRLPPPPPRFDPNGPVDSVSRERHRLIQEGDSGIGSCSTSGAGGMVGCFFRTIKRMHEQHAD